MIYLQINSQIINPGTKLFGPKNVRKTGKLFREEHFDDAISIHLPDLDEKSQQTINKNQIESDENGDYPELYIINGIAQKTIFLIHDLKEIVTFEHGTGLQHEWVVEYMGQIDFEDLRCETPKIYQDILKILEKPKTVTFSDISILPKPETEDHKSNERAYPVTVLTHWSTTTSRDWESQVTEIDSINYEGLAQVSPIQA